VCSLRRDCENTPTTGGRSESSSSKRRSRELQASKKIGVSRPTRREIRGPRRNRNSSQPKGVPTLFLKGGCTRKGRRINGIACKENFSKVSKKGSTRKKEKFFHHDVADLGFKKRKRRAFKKRVLKAMTRGPFAFGSCVAPKTSQ